jgi:glycosyltransferase involved in cell wall biosynthesis
MNIIKQRLAIVIPAFKLRFLDKTLESIFSQTNKNFTVYIGDDNSPEDLYSVIKTFEEGNNLVYEKFEENFGGTSVTKQWERCVAMTKSEEWIWLFSDDDIMKEDSVDLFYKALQETSESYDLYRFNCCIIDDAGNEVTNKSQYPQIQTSYEFLVSRLNYQYHSYIVNCIFSRNVYIKHNGFIDFSGAWAADDATWILYGQEKNIYTLEKGLVQWRTSSINISGNTSNILNRQKKYMGTEQFIVWIYNWSKVNNKIIDDKLVIRWFLNMLGLMGFNNMTVTYLRSKTFKTFFLKKNHLFQIKLMIKTRNRNF